MTRNRFVLSLLFAVLLSISLSQLAAAMTPSEFGIKEYDEFHDVLHPLEHEAMPKKDYQQIRSRAEELVTRGKAVLKLKTPANVPQEKAEEFKTGLAKFDAALKVFSKAAKNGTDDQVRDSFEAVHDSFEMLAHLLPRT